MIAELIARYERELAQADQAGEPANWRISVDKSDLREMIEALKRKLCECGK